MVEVTWRGTGTLVPSSVTYNGGTLTQAVSMPSVGQANYCGAAIYYLSSTSTGWTTGVADALTVNFATAPTDLGLAVISLGGVNLNELPGAGSGELDGDCRRRRLCRRGHPSLDDDQRRRGLLGGIRHRQSHRAGFAPSSITGGNGTLLSTGSGYLLSHSGAEINEAGGLVSNITSPTLTVTQTGSVASIRIG